MTEINELKHRLAMVIDDLAIIRKFIETEGLSSYFDKPSRTSDMAWHNLNNIAIACDLTSDESLCWSEYTLSEQIIYFRKVKKNMKTFPQDFELKAHSVVQGAKHWTLKHPTTNEIIISVVGGGRGLYGNGTTSFEMWDFREAEPHAYLTADDINEHLKNNPINH